MADAEEFSMPSPKRRRTSSQERQAASTTVEEKDDFDDIYNTPPHVSAGLEDAPAVSAEPSARSSSSVPSQAVALPGLGFDELPQPDATAEGKNDAEEGHTRVDGQEGTEHGQTESRETLGSQEPAQEVKQAELDSGAVTASLNGHTSSNKTAHAIVEEQVLPDPIEKSPDAPAYHGHTALIEEPRETSEAAEAAVDLGANEVKKGMLSNSEIEPAQTEPPLDPKSDLHTSFIDRDVNMATEGAEAEFELDSSPLSSSSDSSTDSSSDDDSEDGDDGDDPYTLLSPEEQARRLMMEDGDSDDDGQGKAKPGKPLRTQNEQVEEIVHKPDVEVTEAMRVEELGAVDKIVENMALIKAKTSGEYQVLESGSVLCLQDRSVVGAVAETFGRVEEPYYSVRFTNAAAIAEAGLRQDTKVFYVVDFSTTVFTQGLKGKGSDASNIYDEEVGRDELEFSDDEAEAEHKRNIKMQKQARREGRDGRTDAPMRGGRGGRGRGRGRGHITYDISNASHQNNLPSVQERPPNSAEASLDYDDGQSMAVDTEDLYTPLARPKDLHEMMRRGPAPEAQGPHSYSRERGGNNRRGRPDRGGRENGNRGAFHNGNARSGISNQMHHNPHSPNTWTPQNDLAQSSGSPQGVTHQFPTQSPFSAGQTQSGFNFALPPQNSSMTPGSMPNFPSSAQHQHPSPYSHGQFSPAVAYPHAQPAQPHFQNGMYNQPHFQPTPYNQMHTNNYNLAQPYAGGQVANTAYGNMPAGAHINPAFFAAMQQQQQQQQNTNQGQQPKW